MYYGTSTVRPELSRLSEKRPVSTILESANFRESLESMVITYKLSMTENQIMRKLPVTTDLTSPSLSPPPSFPKRDTTGIIGDTARFCQLSSHLRLLSVKLAVMCRLIEHFGWYLPTLVHCSAKADTATITTPLSMLFSRARATDLLFIHGNSVLPDREVDKGCLQLHRHLLNSHACVITVCTPMCAAVASLNYGLLPLSRDYLQIGDVEYTDADAVLFYIPEAKVIFIRNQGIVVVGSCVEEAFHHLFYALTACAVQKIALTAGADNVLPMQHHLQSLPDSYTLEDYQSHFEHFSNLIFDESISTIADTEIHQTEESSTNPFLPSIFDNRSTNPFLPLPDDSVCEHSSLWDFTEYLYPSVDVWSFLSRVRPQPDNPITHSTEVTVERSLTQVYTTSDNSDNLV